MAALQLNIPEILALAKRHHGESRLVEAEVCYRQVLEGHANHADASNGLALLTWQQGRWDEALQHAKVATRHEPGVWRYHQTQGLIASALQRFDEAARAFERASALCPESPEAWCGLGQALHALRRLDDALIAYVRAQSLAPLSPQAANNFGLALTAVRRYDEALAVLRAGLAQAPASGELWYNLGNALAAQGASPEAIAAFTEALKLQPENTRAWVNLGNVRRARRELEAAIECYDKAITLDRGHHDAYNNLGTALWAAGRIDEALQALQRAIALRPGSSAAHNNLGNVLKDSGRMDDAIAAFRRAVELAPQDPQPHSNLLYSLYFHPDYDEAAIRTEALRWARAHAAASTAAPTGPEGPAAHEDFASVALRGARKVPSRERLHIGYVSPDFREHCQSLFTLPLLSHHDRGRFKIHCYAHLPSPDATSRRLAACADVWRPIYGSSDAEVQGMIRADGIDVLVDLTMHMANGRPLLFARRAAPVQVAWLAYPGTTGLASIDFRLTDPWLDPPEFDDARYTERSLRLPSTFWCYDPGVAPPVNELPAAASGQLTFGCLNNFCKVSDASLRSWAQIMRAVPDSRLLLLAAPGTHRMRVAEIMGGEGIAAQRIEFVPYQPRADYLATYQRIDLCLDTLPYNGHTTSLDAYWMGVPVVTRVGHTVVGRAGWSQLNNLHLSELAAFDDTQFVRAAVSLATDLNALRALRLSLRERMRSSALMDGAAFAAAMESAYRHMWELQ